MSNEPITDKNTTDAAPGERDGLAELIRIGGQRDPIDVEREQRAHDRVSQHWAKVVETHKEHTRSWYQAPGLAIAAAVVLAVAVGLFVNYDLSGTDTDTTGTFTRVVGTVEVDSRLPDVGENLNFNARLTTDNESRAALTLPGGQMMRIDENTQVTALAGDRFRLEYGAVYFDSADSDPSLSVYVETPYGVANDVGTQFQVRIHNDGLVVGVRDGSVSLVPNDASPVAIDSGWFYELSMQGDRGHRKDDSADNWHWIETVVPEFRLEGASLFDYLTWYSREKGLDLMWADAASAAKARAAILSGSLTGQSLDDGLATVQRIAPFSYEKTSTELLVTIE